MLTSIWDISTLKHHFYALVYAAKGPFVLYKIHNIIFEHGFDPPPFEQCSKKLHFSYGAASLSLVPFRALNRETNFFWTKD